VTPPPLLPYADGVDRSAIRFAAILLAALLAAWALRGWWDGQRAIAAPARPDAAESARIDDWAGIVATRDLSADEDVRLLLLRDPLMDEANAYCLLYRHRGWQVVRLECPGVDLSHLGYEQR
jgi:hypothetical protein